MHEAAKRPRIMTAHRPLSAAAPPGATAGAEAGARRENIFRCAVMGVDILLVLVHKERMAKAFETLHLASQPHGVGARLLRRLGGAVRNVIAGGLTLAGAPRRPVASQPGIGHTVVRNAHACPVPGRASRARRPRTAAPARPPQPARPVWLARLLGRRPRPAPVSASLFPGNRDTPFTPETVPGLGPELCAVLNTPLEDCDPEIVRILLASLAQTIARSMPSEAGQAWRTLSSTLSKNERVHPLGSTRKIVSSWKTS